LSSLPRSAARPKGMVTGEGNANFGRVRRQDYPLTMFNVTFGSNIFWAPGKEYWQTKRCVDRSSNTEKFYPVTELGAVDADNNASPVSSRLIVGIFRCQISFNSAQLGGIHLDISFRRIVTAYFFAFSTAFLSLVVALRCLHLSRFLAFTNLFNCSLVSFSLYCSCTS
jgi:hypothetical protein